MSGQVKKGYARPLDIKHGRVDMSHGGGGRAMVQLITDLFAKHLSNEYLAQGNDGTCLPRARGLVVSTDSHVVSPLFFPGGDIGGLSVHGTVNDVAVMGATPLYLTAGFILEEGFPLADLARIVESMARAANEAGVKLVAGDTKVVEQGKGDGVFITTTGIGFLPDGIHLSGDLARPGDVLLVSGTRRRPRRGHHVQAGEPELRRAHPVRHGFAEWFDRRHAGQRRQHQGHARPHPGRPGRHHQRDRPPVRRRHPPGGSRDSGEAGSGRRLRTAGPGPASTSPTKASSSPSAPPRTPTSSSPPCAPIPRAGRRRSSARWWRTPTASCR
jgi:hypothetical protein